MNPATSNRSARPRTPAGTAPLQTGKPGALTHRARPPWRTAVLFWPLRSALWPPGQSLRPVFCGVSHPGRLACHDLRSHRTRSMTNGSVRPLSAIARKDRATAPAYVHTSRSAQTSMSNPGRPTILLRFAGRDQARQPRNPDGLGAIPQALARGAGGKPCTQCGYEVIPRSKCEHAHMPHHLLLVQQDVATHLAPFSVTGYFWKAALT